MVFDGFKMSGPLVFCTQRVIEAHLEGLLVALAVIAIQSDTIKCGHWSAQVVGLPGTYPQAICAIGEGESIDNKSI
jgi:hypothetical protein